jgi:hypothetical protein
MCSSSGNSMETKGHPTKVAIATWAIRRMVHRKAEDRLVRRPRPREDPLPQITPSAELNDDPTPAQRPLETDSEPLEPNATIPSIPPRRRFPGVLRS